MIRGLVATVLLFLATLAGAADGKCPVLVLIEPQAAGPVAPPDSYVHDAWALWAPAEESSGNRILSIVTGADWRGSPADYRFVQMPPNVWRADNLRDLRERGHFRAKREALGTGTSALAMRPSAANAVLLLAVEESGRVRPVDFKERWPANRLLIADAKSWDDVARIEHSPDAGRVLVIEYPPPRDAEISHLWLRGRGWPDGRAEGPGWIRPAVPVEAETGGVPGLIPAHDLGRLALLDPKVEWIPDPGPRWTGADRWFRYVQGVAPWVRGVLGLATLALIVWGLRIVADERRSRGYAVAAVAFFLTIPTVMAAGRIAYFGGLGAWLVAFPVAAFIVAGLANTGRWLAKRHLPAAHTLWGIALVAVGVLVLTDPATSVFAGPLARVPMRFAPESLGALLAGLVVLVAGARAEPLCAWGARGLAVGIAVLGFFASAWWADRHPLLAALPLLAWLAGNRRLRLWVALPGLVLSDGLIAALNHGVAFRAGGLIATLPEKDAFDLAVPARFLASPAFLIGALIAVATFVFMPPFAARQVRRVWHRSPLVRPLATLASSLAILGLLQPPLLDTAFVVGGAAVVMLFVEGVWTSNELA